MAVELEHPFTTARPIDDSFAADHSTSSAWCRASRAGAVLETTGPDAVRARDRGEDGRDVDDVHGHRRDRREGPRRAHRAC